MSESPDGEWIEPKDEAQLRSFVAGCNQRAEELLDEVACLRIEADRKIRQAHQYLDRAKQLLSRGLQ